MKRIPLKEKEKDELVRLVRDLQLKLKRKHQRLAATEIKLSKSKESINRLQGIVLYQRERILEFYKEQFPSTRDIINDADGEGTIRKAS